ncbi:DUF3828 domain-containing protein [Phenylobacterium sp.]|uniref:DUF3828 domain-containing protein n=1 Tax=Phenylobacterium sp. TaxID=1871053 RepID=UPI00356760B2
MRARSIVLAAVLALAPPAASAQDAASANAFVRKLYAAYHGDGPDYAGRQAKTTFSPAFLRLMRRAAADVPTDEVGPLDGDPICDCQDFEISRVDVQIAGGTGGRARATAHFRNFGEPQTVRLDLVAVKGHWRVDDVHSAGTPSYVAYLRESLNNPGNHHAR